MMVDVHGHAGQHCHSSLLVCVLALHQIMCQILKHLCM